MQLVRTSSVWKCTVKAAFAALLAFGLIVTMGAAGSKEFHRHLHHEADSHGHECLVTLLSDGLLDVATSYAIVVQVTDWPESESSAAVTVFVPVPTYQLLPSRGPPACFS